MTGESSVATSATDRRQQLATRWCACGRQASKSSGYRFCWDCDPSVSAENKALARQLGGRRGAMTPSEVVRLLEGADLDTREGRQQLRDRFLRLRLAGRIGTGVYRDLLAAVDGAAKDQERPPKKAPPTPIVVEVPTFNGHGASS